LLLASGAENGTIHIFDISTGKLLHSLPGHSMAIRSLEFSMDSHHLFSVSDDKRVNMYDVSHANCIATMTGHQSWVLSVDVSPTGNFIATGYDVV
jgi:WD repeat-containing protein 61